MKYYITHLLCTDIYKSEIKGRIYTVYMHHQKKIRILGAVDVVSSVDLSCWRGFVDMCRSNETLATCVEIIPKPPSMISKESAEVLVAIEI